MKILNKIIVSLVLMSSIVSANSVGAITALQGSASIIREAKEIEATLGTKLEEKDTIQTKDETKVQIVFNDDTIITIGKNSNFSINEYLFDENKAPSAQFGLLNGAMRTITGKIGKIAPDKFSVQTKTATIGIRGTNFTIIAELDGSSRVFCTFGAISVSVKGETSTVTQGFYVLVSSEGKRSESIKFTPTELDKMRSDSFTDAKNKKEEESKGLKEATEAVSSANTDTQLKEVGTITSKDVTTQIDTTKAENIGLVVKDITFQTTSAVQVDVVDKVDKAVKVEADRVEAVRIEAARVEAERIEAARVEAERIEAARVEAERIEAARVEAERIEAARVAAANAAAAQAAAAQAAAATFEISGYTVGYTDSTPATSMTSSTVNLKTSNTSTFDTGSSNLKVGAWTFTPASAMTGSGTLGSFGGTLTNPVNTNVINPSITSSAFAATNDDYSSSDDMSWGTWNATVSYGGTTPTTSAFNGLWVAGKNQATVSDYNSYISTSIDYSGKYKAINFNNSNASVTGNASMNVNFGTDSATLTISAFPTDSTPTVDVGYTVSAGNMSNTFTGTQDGGQQGNSGVKGAFYGSACKDIAGSFVVDKATQKGVGVFQVHTTATLSTVIP